MVHHELSLSSVKGQTSPQARQYFFDFLPGGRLLHIIHAAASASVFTPPLLLFNAAAIYKIGNGAFDGTAGQLQVRGDGTNRRITFSVLVRPVFQVHVYGYRPVGQL
jgi:hypothetical protein